MSEVCITVNWLACMTQDEVDALDPVQKNLAEHFAELAIRVLTGRQVGNCPITVRPCLSRCEAEATDIATPWMVPFIRDGVWYNSCGCKPKDCSCESLDIIYLDGPVGGIVEVKVEGAVVPASGYRVDNLNELVRLGGEPWPTCQDMGSPTSAAGTMSVTYIRGAALDSTGEFIAAILAKEYLSACNGGECSLPTGVTSIARQGVQVEFGPEVFPGGRTGIDVVDLWAEAWNPYKVKAPSRVHSVDKVKARQTTWSA